jgi:hypothetical protein
MSVKGKSGKDVGIFFGFPIACAMVHAAHGEAKKARHILDSCLDFWNEYAKVLFEGGRDEIFLIDAFRGALGGAFLYQFFAYYAFGLYSETLPFEGLSEENANKAKATFGLVGLWFGEEAYGETKSDVSLDELIELFESKIANQIEELIESCAEPMEEAKSSTAAANHTVEPAEMLG